MTVSLSDIKMNVSITESELSSVKVNYCSCFRFYISCIILVSILCKLRLHKCAPHYETIQQNDIMRSLVVQAIDISPISKNNTIICEYNSLVSSNVMYYNSVNFKEIYNPDEIQLGGEYYPTDCQPLYSSAIVVAYRNRPKQLELFTTYIHNYLRQQKIHYRLFIVEQVNDTPFNRGKLLNLGAQIAMEYNFSCLILHDVDMMPERLGNLYACTTMPRHMAASINKFRYNLPYLYYFGAVTSIDSPTYKLINGFSNVFEGWGGEDDDFLNRVLYHDKYIFRFPIEWSQYRMLAHQQETPNKNRKKLVSAGLSRLEQDGLNTLTYKLVDQSLTKFSTHTYANVE